jgi:hypothetical protein
MHRWPALVRLRVRFRSTSARRFRSSLPVPCCTLFCESGACRAVAPERQRGAKAGDATRTRDIFLGKEVLYQLSYTRRMRKKRIMLPEHAESSTFLRRASGRIVLVCCAC